MSEASHGENYVNMPRRLEQIPQSPFISPGMSETQIRILKQSQHAENLRQTQHIREHLIAAAAPDAVHTNVHSRSAISKTPTQPARLSSPVSATTSTASRSLRAESRQTGTDTPTREPRASKLSGTTSSSRSTIPKRKVKSPPAWLRNPSQVSALTQGSLQRTFFRSSGNATGPAKAEKLQQQSSYVQSRPKSGEQIQPCTSVQGPRSRISVTGKLTSAKKLESSRSTFLQGPESQQTEECDFCDSDDASETLVSANATRQRSTDNKAQPGNLRHRDSWESAKAGRRKRLMRKTPVKADTAMSVSSKTAELKRNAPINLELHHPTPISPLNRHRSLEQENAGITAEVEDREASDSSTKIMRHESQQGDLMLGLRAVGDTDRLVAVTIKLHFEEKEDVTIRADLTSQ
jgi:hypothetical protein